MKFTSKQHESNFLDLMVTDNTYHDDKERQSLWYIIAGDNDLYRKRNHIYDFADHSIKHCLDDGSVDFCSSGRSLVRLGFNLYNNYQTDGLSPCELFWSLDSHSMSLALNAMKLRFDSMETVEFHPCEDVQEIAEEEQEYYEI